MIGTRLVRHLEGWAVFRPGTPVIVDPCRGDVGVPKPFLHLGDISLVVERVGGCGRTQRMRADLEPELR